MYLKKVDGWNVNKDENNNYFLIKEFKFKDFKESQIFINKVGDLSEIENLYYFKSGRWDIETKFDVLIKLPKYHSRELLDLSVELLKKNEFDKIKILDFRQNNQVIINGK